MEPDYPDPLARPSFPFPIDAITEDMATLPHVTVVFPCSWLPAVRGALQQLTQQATWKGTPTDILVAQSLAMTLISEFEECSSADLPFSCPYDMTLSENGWTLSPWPGQTPTTLGSWSSPDGWTNTLQDRGVNGWWSGVDIIRSLSGSIVLDQVVLDFGYTPGTIDAGFTHVANIYLLSGGSVVAQKHWGPSEVASGPNTLVWSFVGVTCDQVEVYIVSEATGSSSDAGVVDLTSVTIEGVGSFFCG